MAADTLSGPRNPFPDEPRGLTSVQWLICVIAAIGFAFDIYELLMLPLILPPALLELVGSTARPGTPEFEKWVAIMFFVPAAVGGVFGLLGGYLTDRLGRRRVLTWSILLYAFSAFFAGFSTNIWMLLVLRSTTFVGVCVEFVAAVAWLAELFPDHKRRERVLGYTQAFSSIGGFLVAVVFGWIVRHAGGLPAIAMPGFLTGLFGTIDPAHQHEAWRYTLMSGLIPAIPLIIIRPFLPESPVWAQKRAAGTLRRPSIAELFAPALRRTTIVTTILFACSYGAAFGAIQQMQRIVPGMPDVRARTEGKPPPEVRKTNQAIYGTYTTVQEIGGLLGRFTLALLVVRFLSRQKLLRLFQVPGLLIFPLLFGFVTLNNRTLFTIGTFEVTTFAIGIFLAGFVTVAQFSFWGNYLPLVYPVHLRGTGESFAANIGGRMIGTSFAAVTVYLVQPLMPGPPGPVTLTYAAAVVGTFVYVVGLIFSFMLPEPRTADLHE